MSSSTLDISPPKPRGLLQLLKSHPPGFWFIFWGELAERCSYYGMMAILARFISEKLGLGDGDASDWVSYFKAGCYFLPLLGGFLADQYLGKYRLIVIFSIPYILGHVILYNETYWWTIVALGLLAMGSGVIKPNISTLMGLTYDQKRPGDDQLRTFAFGMFYMAINIGAMVSSFFMPLIRDATNYRTAFLCPAVLMAVSFVLFAVGKPFYAVETIQRRKYTPQEWAEMRLTLRRIAGLFLVITFFWAIFDQSHTTWIFFARDFTDLQIFGLRLSPEQVSSINPLLIVVFVPVLAVVWGVLEARGIKARPTDKIMIGFFLTAATMGILAWAGHRAVPSGEITSTPALKSDSENDPYVITTPPVDIKAIETWQKKEKSKQAPPLVNVTELKLTWIGRDKPPEVAQVGNDTVITWATHPWIGKEESGRIVVRRASGTPEPTVTFDSENGVLVTTSPATVTIDADEVAATKKRIVAPENKVTLWWEVLAFVVLTLAEILISVTGLELAFVISPLSMKSVVTALWLVTVGVANLFINKPVGRQYAGMAPGDYFGYLALATLGVIVVFFFVAKRFNALGDQTPALSNEDAERILSDQIPGRGGPGEQGIQPSSERDGVK